MQAEDRQWYIRAEPTEESRRALQEHQRHLQVLFRDLRINPRLTKDTDFHWTALFLGSARRWTRALRSLNIQYSMTADDLNHLAQHVRDALSFRLEAKLPVVGSPTAYDAFLTGGTSAVFVLRLEHLQSTVDALVRCTQEFFAVWERQEKLPRGTTHRLFRHRDVPLARERDGGKPHVTLARGRVSRERQRDVLRTIRSASLASRQPITFRHAEVRIVRESVSAR